jgi:hypothetical protein
MATSTATASRSQSGLAVGSLMASVDEELMDATARKVMPRREHEINSRMMA